VHYNVITASKLEGRGPAIKLGSDTIAS